MVMSPTNSRLRHLVFMCSTTATVSEGRRPCLPSQKGTEDTWTNVFEVASGRLHFHPFLITKEVTFGLADFLKKTKPKTYPQVPKSNLIFEVFVYVASLWSGME